MKAFTLTYSILTILAYSVPTNAFNYHELKVYGYETADPHETEFENLSSVSSNNILRSSFELNHGFTDTLEAATYLDYQQDKGSKLNIAAVRTHLRKSFYKPGELLVDNAAYVEAAVPSDSDESYTLEAKYILQKTFDRLSLILSPGIEYVKLKEKNSNGKDIEIEKNISSSLRYASNDHLQLHLDYLGELKEDPVQLLIFGADYEIKHGLKIAAGLGNNNTNDKIVFAGLEFEIE